MIQRSLVLAFTIVLLCGQSPITSFPPGMFANRASQDSNSSSALVLDGVSNVKVAYSYARKLLTSYAGNAMTIQETTGHTTQAIGFTGSPPILDTSAISTFCSGKTCVVATLNDQSGGGADCTQATEAAMPIIYASGALKTLNSKPAAFYSSGSSLYCDTASLAVNPTSTLWQNAVVFTSNNATAQAITAPKGATASLVLRLNTSLNLELVQSFTAVLATSSGTISSGTASVVEGQTDGVNNYSFWIDGSASGSGTLTGAPVSLTAGTLEFGSERGGALIFIGNYAEYIAIDGSGTPSSRGTIQANQKSFYGTP